MKAKLVQAIVFENSDGKVEEVYFSKEAALVFLEIHKEYLEEADRAELLRKLQEFSDAKHVITSSDLPEKATSADGKVMAWAALAEGLTICEQQLLGKNGKTVPAEGYPGFALCCFVRGGTHGLSLAFSQEASKAMMDKLAASGVYSHKSPEQLESFTQMIIESKWPWPKNRVMLDGEFAAMCESLTRANHNKSGS